MNPESSTTGQQISSEEALTTIVASLPPSVQAFVTGPDRSIISLALTQKYALTPAQADGFEHAFTFMLLGLFTPEQFVQNLRNDAIPESIVQGLAQDVNEQVFMKLRDAENASTATQQTPQYMLPTQLPEPLLQNSYVPAPTAYAYQPTAPVVPQVAAPQPVVQAPTPLAETAAPVLPPIAPSLQPQTNREALHKILTEYGVDPYRESFDEKNP